MERLSDRSGFSIVEGLIILVVVVLIAVVGYSVWFNQSDDSSESTTTETGDAKTIPSAITNNAFGWLTFSPEEDAQTISDYGGRWARPHPGPFAWERVQSESGAEYDWGVIDNQVEGFQKQSIGILATVWPFATWDQMNRADADSCKASDGDVFNKPGGPSFFVDADYLSQYRCNPADWNAYTAWIKAMVERYDGDGQDDMPGLSIPIKYWEVLNEPDLNDAPDLSFYKQDSLAYRELLIKTSLAIKSADSEAQVLVAGAAGGSNQFLDFYRTALANKQAQNAFDIGNVHCISNDQYDSFNVAPYKALLRELGIDKPLWVTEAQATVTSDEDLNASQTYDSTQTALDLGAERIFFTGYNFEPEPGAPPQPGPPPDPQANLQAADPTAAFQRITSLDD